MNPIYEQRILGLDPKLQVLCRKLLSESFKIGLDARVIQGVRSPEEQAKLYAKGRTAPGRIVTYAKPGQSNHEKGTAFDIGIFRTDGSYVDNNDTLLMVLGPIGEKLGLCWGFRWKRPDCPHFELPERKP